MGQPKTTTERRMVIKATPLVFSALRLSPAECRFTHELTVGLSIADLVILRTRCARLWPEAPLSIAESAVLSSLRKLGQDGDCQGPTQPGGPQVPRHARRGGGSGRL